MRSTHVAVAVAAPPSLGAAAVSRRPWYIACSASSSPLWARQPRRISSAHGVRLSQVTLECASQGFSVGSHCVGCGHATDRARRRRHLEECIHAAQAFRSWCAEHAPCAQAVGRTPASATAARRSRELSPSHAAALHGVGSSGGRVVTLADIGYEEAADSSTRRRHLSSGSQAAQATSPPLTVVGEIPLTELRMLEHYAVLLHDVRAAAARVARSDYRGLYAVAVKELLTGSAPLGGSGAISVPRSVVWQGAAAPSYRGESGEDATAQAERRLGEWASSWYEELQDWHSRHSTHAPEASDADDGQQPLLHDELWQDVLDGRESVVGARAEDKSMAALLLQGQWRAAVDRLLEADAARPCSAPAASMELHGRSPAAPQRLSVAELFSSASVLRRHRVPWRPSPHQGSANPSSGTLPSLPRRLALAPVTPAEMRLLLHPPSPGLRVLRHSIADDEQRARYRERPAGDEVTGSPSLLLEAAAAAEVAAGRATGVPPTCVVRLRRRLWVLQHLPRHLPASLVRFQESRRLSRRASGGKGCEVPSGAMPQPYLLRSSALEKLPWYALCVLGEVLEVTGKEKSKVPIVLRNARTHMGAALFLSVAPDYAALHDYVHALFLTLGSNMVAHTVAARQRERRRSASGGDGDSTVTELEGAFAQTAIALLQPPPLEAYAAAGLSTRPTAASATAASFPSRSSSAMTPSCSTDIADVHEVPPRVFSRLCAAAQDWRNYHLSLYCETLSHIADSDGAALRELMRALAGQLHYSQKQHGEDGLREDALLVLAPESAAAIFTALLLQRLDQLSRRSAPPLSATARDPPSSSSAGRHPQDTSPSPPPQPQVLYFSAPHDKAHAVAAYFKGVFHPSFFKRVVAAAEGLNGKERQLRDDDAAATSPTPTPLTTSARTADEGNGNASVLPAFVLPPGEWERNAVARLVGRTLRRLDRYPTRTTEAFFARYVRGDDVGWKKEVETDGSGEVAAAATSSPTSVAPPLAVNLFVVNLQAAVDYWHDHHPNLRVPPTAAKRPLQEAHVPLQTQSCATAAATPTSVEAPLNKDGLRDAIALLASPPIVPRGLYAVYKPAGVNCTLHAHYPSLVYPFLTCALPWRAREAVAADGSDGHRDSGVSSSPPLPPSLPPACVPVLRQQGLVNRIDVGTSGVVLVARTAAALHGAADAMTREHHVRKTYRALVQRWPPFYSSGAYTAACGDGSGRAAPLFSISPFLSPMTSAAVCAPVYAAGATAASIRRCPALPLGHGRGLQSPTQHSAAALSASDAASTLSLSSSVPTPPSTLAHVHQQYATLHAALKSQRHAITRYRVLEYFACTGVAYVQVELHSGRRHQIRQHFAQLGFPLLGDTRYHAGVVAGHSRTMFGMRRAALHAYTIDILATAEGDGQASDEEVPGRVLVQAALPADMNRALLALRQAEQVKSHQQQRLRRG
ncbi:hypothetical protein CUR178_07907 [Leishmania enriettii]|uniref:Pseudouridine synthase RsuA/RluA-like domain-containing protein n=1 Tax=Leishmania enriettii TaxID=5663 RepID=A0A836HLW6_LEIEN|nr:hypothetical protein CUR178_07907 [Leishmania enriettii]